MDTDGGHKVGGTPPATADGGHVPRPRTSKANNHKYFQKFVKNFTTRPGTGCERFHKVQAAEFIRQGTNGFTPESVSLRGFLCREGAAVWNRSERESEALGGGAWKD
jgi:hypothetical protein